VFFFLKNVENILLIHLFILASCYRCIIFSSAPPVPQALLTLHGRRLPLTGRPKGVAGAPAIPPLHIAFAAIGGDDYFATASDDDEDDEPLLDDEDSEDEEGDDEVDDADLGTTIISAKS
jgi:hypothetical protein